MATFNVIADNGEEPMIDEIFCEYAPAYLRAVALSRKFLYVEIRKNNMLIEEYGPNEKIEVI